MRLHVMRHGPAEDRAASGRDFDRALTAPGREIVRRMGGALRSALEAHASAGPEPLRILASPRVRARETATLVRAELVPLPREVELVDELDGSDSIPLSLVTEIRAAGADTLLVGHQPVVEELTRALLQPAGLPISGFHTAMIVTLTASANGGWTFGSVLDPRR